MKTIAIFSGYVVPIYLVFFVFVLFKLKRDTLPVFLRSQSEAHMALLASLAHAALIIAANLYLTHAFIVLNDATIRLALSITSQILSISPLIVLLSFRKQGLSTIL
jgi:hypothetical protein